MPDPNTAEQIDVDLPGGVTVKLPKDQADRVIRGRDELKEGIRSANETLGRIKAAKEEAEAKAQREADAKAAVEAAKKGEIDQARELLQRDFKVREDRMAARLKADAVSQLLTKNGSVVQSSVADAGALLASRLRYNLDSGSLEVLSADGSAVEKNTDGSAVQADAWLAGWLKDRPHFLRDTTASGSGGKKTLPASNGQKMARDEWEKLEPVARAKFFADGGSLI